MGICTSAGIIRDFAGPYFVSVSSLPCIFACKGPILSQFLRFCTVKFYPLSALTHTLRVNNECICSEHGTSNHFTVL